MTEKDYIYLKCELDLISDIAETFCVTGSIASLILTKRQKGQQFWEAYEEVLPDFKEEAHQISYLP